MLIGTTYTNVLTHVNTSSGEVEVISRGLVYTEYFNLTRLIRICPADLPVSIRIRKRIVPKLSCHLEPDKHILLQWSFFHVL
jgi:hypothetical protein